MEWTQEADDAVKKVPFFVRKRVRARVENEARQAGKKVVSLADVKTTQARYLKSMASEVKGYQVETCFGPSGCPNRAVTSDRLLEQIESLLAKEDILGFLTERVKGELKFHHEFRVTLADCPNACSQPQIKDIGIIGACSPKLSDEPCSRCEACVDACKEDAITLDGGAECPQIDYDRCLHCGKCMQVCPTGTIVEGAKGYRVQLGGKLGRHPQLARELPGIYSEQKVIEIVRDCIRLYKQRSRHGERFGQILTSHDIDELAERYRD
ncbi:MAG: 4Fe-4S binding protein [Desulfobacterales bacterium]|nr:MAG: 4Fe-4S binding protein [Desulfobacterales bacterium]